MKWVIYACVLIVFLGIISVLANVVSNSAGNESWRLPIGFAAGRIWSLISKELKK